MKMTRRAFFMHPARPIGEDLENAGEWLRRAGQKGSALAGGGCAAEAAGEQKAPTAARGIALRNARANMRRNDHGLQ